MKIHAVTIGGFKNISNIRLSFDSITALVSLNNFGKSTVLTAIDFGLDFINGTVADKSDMMANTDYVPLNKSMVGQNFHFELDLHTFTDSDNKEYQVIYGFEFCWKTDETKDPYIVSEDLRYRPINNGQKFTQLIKRNEEKALYKSSVTGRCSSKIKVGSAELVVNKLLAYDDIFSAQIIQKLNSLKFYMENHLDVKRFYQADPILRKGLDDVAITAINLPRVVYLLKEKYKEKYDLLIEVYKELFPSIENVIVKKFNFNAKDADNLPDEAPFVIAKELHVLFVKDEKLAQPIDFAMMSDGAKRVFMILVKLVLADVSNVSLIAIEEPENSVHPSLFQAYIQIISQLVSDCRIIITSHSPYIVGYLDPLWIYVGINRKPGVADFYTFKKNGSNLLQREADMYDMGMGDYLFSLLSDDETDWTEYLECNANG